MRQFTALFFVILLLIGFLLAIRYVSFVEPFALKCPAFSPIQDKPVIPDAPRPPAIGLSDKPIS